MRGGDIAVRRLPVILVTVLPLFSAKEEPTPVVRARLSAGLYPQRQSADGRSVPGEAGISRHVERAEICAAATADAGIDLRDKLLSALSVNES